MKRYRDQLRFPLNALAFLACLLAAPAALGQGVELNVESREAYVDEALRVEVVLRNFSSAGEIEFPEIPGCKVAQIPGTSDSRHISILGGRRVESVTRAYTFELTPTQPGELVIPAISVELDGRQYSTRPARINVRVDDSAPLLLAEIVCNEQRLYVGQSAAFTLTIFIKPARFDRMTLDEQDMLNYVTASLGPFPTQGVRVGRTMRTAPDGTRQLYYTYTVSATTTLDRPGPIRFDEVSIGVNYPLRIERDVFMTAVPTRTRRVRVEPTVIGPEVLPLPEGGRPDAFNGAVGQFSIDVSASPRTVHVGDPIELKIILRGDGPLDTLPGPLLAEQPALTEGFRVPEEALAGAVMHERGKIFTQVIRAKDASVTEIPAITYPYFDPERGEYVIARSAPIPIRVSEAEQLAVSDLDIGGESGADAGQALQTLDGLRGPRVDEAELLASTGAVSAAQLLTATLAPPAAFAMVACGFWISRGRGAPARRRRQHAMNEASRRLGRAAGDGPAQASREIQAALTGYLADRLNEPPARFVGRAGIELLRERNAPTAAIESFQNVIQRCERAAYAGGAEGVPELLSEARACLMALERSGL